MPLVRGSGSWAASTTRAAPAAIRLSAQFEPRAETWAHGSSVTKAVASRAAHPIRALWDAGIALSFHTDSRLISGVSPSSEAASLVREGRFSFAELAQMSLGAARASFLPEAAKARAEAAISAWSPPGT